MPTAAIRRNTPSSRGCSSSSAVVALREGDEVAVRVSEHDLACAPRAILDAPLGDDGLPKGRERGLDVVDIDIDAPGQPRIAVPRRLASQELQHDSIATDLAPTRSGVVAPAVHRETGRRVPLDGAFDV